MPRFDTKTGHDARDWGWHKVAGRTNNQATVYQTIKLVRMLRGRIHRHIHLRADGREILTKRIGIENQNSFDTWLEKIEKNLEKVLTVSETKRGI